MFLKTMKAKKIEECMQNVKLATLYRCASLYCEDPAYVSIDWDPVPTVVPVYIHNDIAISLINGEEYSIIRSSDNNKIKNIEKVEIEKFYVHFLSPLSSQYNSKQIDTLYQSAKDIHESYNKDEKSKQKAYS